MSSGASHNSSDAKILSRAHLIISGRVQGVFYRATAQQEAVRRKLNGWAKNLSTGQVEMVLEGEKSVVEDMIRWCHQGPRGSQVSSIEVDWNETPEHLDDFRILY